MKLTIDDLSVQIKGISVLEKVHFSLPEDGAAGIAGASGSGKTMFTRSLMGLLPGGGRAEGVYRLDGQQMDLNAGEKFWRTLRGRKLGMVMQDPFTALDPARKCGRQILDGVPGPSRKTFDLVGALREVDLAADVARRLPRTLSGGMRQRVVIAAALATEPEILIADEATTALDPVTRKEILSLLERIRTRRNMALILISHDLGVLAEQTRSVTVFHQGRVVESGATGDVIRSPEHEYTRMLLDAWEGTGPPETSRPPSGLKKQKERRVYLTVEGLSKSFGTKKILDDVSLKVHQGEWVGLVGQSGSGKTTLSRCIVGLTVPEKGQVIFHREEKTAEQETGSARQDVAMNNKRGPADGQIIFQDPYASLNPAHTVERILKEALRAGGRPENDVSSLMTAMDLPPEFRKRKPDRLSGGQRQRVAIARALATAPRLLICDESLSALDVIVRRQILETLRRYQREQGLAILFISHDLNLVRQVADRILVMKEGVIVEEGEAEALFNKPVHPYTKTLLAAIPKKLSAKK